MAVLSLEEERVLRAEGLETLRKPPSARDALEVQWINTRIHLSRLAAEFRLLLPETFRVEIGLKALAPRQYDPEDDPGWFLITTPGRRIRLPVRRFPRQSYARAAQFLVIDLLAVLALPIPEES
jgi:hypothetical protein